MSHPGDDDYQIWLDLPDDFLQSIEDLAPAPDQSATCGYEESQPLTPAEEILCKEIVDGMMLDLELDQQIADIEMQKKKGVQWVRDNKKDYMDLVAPLKDRRKVPKEHRSFNGMGRDGYTKTYYEANRQRTIIKNRINMHLNGFHAKRPLDLCNLCNFEAQLDDEISRLKARKTGLGV